MWRLDPRTWTAFAWFRFGYLGLGLLTLWLLDPPWSHLVVLAGGILGVVVRARTAPDERRDVDAHRRRWSATDGSARRDA